MVRLVIFIVLSPDMAAPDFLRVIMNCRIPIRAFCIPAAAD
jgi:hypothetical protein